MATAVEVVGASSITTTPGTTGTGTSTGAERVVTASDSPEIALIGAVTETAPATDTASSGLNGRLQRIAQRLTSMIALLPAALGAGGGLKVDGSGTALPVSGTVATTNSDITAAAASLSVLDDWDESDRAKVNLVVGQAGITGGAGAVAANTPRVTFASDAPGIADAVAGEYETVAASQTTQTLGATGAAGDYLEAVWIIPTTVDAGAVSIKDGANSAISIFAGGTASLTSLAPIYCPFGMKSTNGAWQITTGAGVSAIGIGNFT
jgi:hypothetical protein